LAMLIDGELAGDHHGGDFGQLGSYEQAGDLYATGGL
jgi:hypothetical protein